MNSGHLLLLEAPAIEDFLYPCCQRACVESVFRVMHLTSIAADAFGVVTICLVAILILLGLMCIAYSIYFRSRIRQQGFFQLNYFSGPWIIRITFILFAIWWGLGEIIRLTLLRRVLHLKWKETVCKCYIVSNLGFAEPCLFLTLVFLLRAPLQKLETGIMSRKWNAKTAGYILLYCFPMFVLQLFVILVGPQLNKNNGSGKKLPHYFTTTAFDSSSMARDNDTLCTYPLLSTILLGLFAVILTSYLFWLGSRILKLVINKGLQKRVYTLLLSVSGFLPLRVLFLGLSVLSEPEHMKFEAFVFLAFLALVCCAGLCMCTLVYRPIADCLALGNLQDLEARRTNVDNNDTMSLIANQSHLEDVVEENSRSSPGRYSDASTKRGSISFRTLEKDVASTGTFVELSLFSPSRSATPPGSPPLLGWPMRSPAQI
ncbi:hypothetical protein Ahy_A04g021378 isoform B [Arachis hypogaea]|uniref:Uncharacterized protein n=1 Tax=Arachis hypogaea TaxID=3818 RepID=A0A445DK36_ARAHY|nr:hypothetical protein Ahy_A04g021378 isoform B [Arachis hypogaea]